MIVCLQCFVLLFTLIDALVCCLVWCLWLIFCDWWLIGMWAWLLVGLVSWDVLFIDVVLRVWLVCVAFGCWFRLVVVFGLKFCFCLWVWCLLLIFVRLWWWVLLFVVCCLTFIVCDLEFGGLCVLFCWFCLFCCLLMC